MERKNLLDYQYPLGIGGEDGDEVLTSARILSLFFKPADAFWEHDGDPKSPHAELTSGKCSNAFFDCMRVLCYPNLCEILAKRLARLIQFALEERTVSIDWVVSSSYAAITFGHEVAKALNAKFGFTEKDQNDPKKQVWQRMTIPKDSIVLQVEELITTSQTFREVKLAVKAGNSEPVRFLPIIGTLIHRPSELSVDYGGIKIISVIEREVWAVEQENCSLCAQGSKRVRPKTNWAELTGRVQS